MAPKNDLKEKISILLGLTMYEDAIVSTLPDRQAVSILPFPESVLESSMSDNKNVF